MPEEQHRHSPAALRARQMTGPERTQTDRLAPPAPVSPYLDSAEEISALTDGSPRPLGPVERIYGGLVTLAEHLVSHSNRLDHVLARFAELQAWLNASHIDTLLVLSQAPQRISYNGRHHVWVWTGAAANNVVLACGSATRAMTLAAGWTQLDPPSSDAYLYVSDASTPSVYVRATNQPPQIAG